MLLWIIGQCLEWSYCSEIPCCSCQCLKLMTLTQRQWFLTAAYNIHILHMTCWDGCHDISYRPSEASIIIRALLKVRRSLYFKQSMMSWWLLLHWEYSVFIIGFIIPTRHNQTSGLQPADQSEAGCCRTLHQLLATEFWNRKINGPIGVNCLVIGS